MPCARDDNAVAVRESEEEPLKHTIAKWLLSATFLAAAGLSTPALAGGVSELPKEIRDELYNPENIDPM